MAVMPYEQRTWRNSAKRKILKLLRRSLNSTLGCFQATLLELDAGRRTLIRVLEVYDLQEIFREKIESWKQALKDGMDHM